MEKKLVIIVSAANWDGVYHRPHHFARRFARLDDTKVLYVEPPVTLLGPIKNRESITTWKNWKNGAREVEENLFVLSPPPVFPFAMKNEKVNKINQRKIAREIQKTINDFKLPTTKPVLYNFLPSTINMLEFFDFAEKIYDCVDDHSEFNGLINKEVMLNMEKRICETADLCLATAQKLLDDKVQWNSNFHLVNNGAEYEHFSNESVLNEPAPSDFPINSKPTIGFVGGIGTWIDLKWMIELANRTKDTHNFVVIGPASVDISSLTKQQNVSYLGPKHYNELPKYYHRFNFAISPFKIERLTESVNPIKMYEYLSAGLPVISTGLVEVKRYSDVVEICDTGNDAADYIEQFTDTPEQKAIRKQTGKDNSWDSRFKSVLSLTETFSNDLI